MLDKEKGTKRMKIIFLMVIIFIVACGIYLIYSRKNAERCNVVILEKESFLSGFEVINNEVHIYCEVSLKNSSSDAKKVKLTGNFRKEVKSGLLKEDSLEACFTEFGADNIVVEGNSSKKNIKIDFMGEYAGNPHMRNRLLPDIEVVEIK